LQTGYIRVDFVTFENGMRPVGCAAHPTGRSLEGDFVVAVAELPLGGSSLA